jgi:hypothetical protein
MMRARVTITFWHPDFEHYGQPGEVCLLLQPALERAFPLCNGSDIDVHVDEVEVEPEQDDAGPAQLLCRRRP